MAQVRRIEPGDPAEPAVERLVDRTFGKFFGARYWRWKYRDPHVADDAVVFVGEIDGEPMAANHYLPFDFKLGPDLVVPAMSAGDIVVEPTRRGTGISRRLSQQGRQAAGDVHPDAVVVFMWTRPGLGQHYTKILGYARPPNGTIRYQKVLGWDPKLARLAAEESEPIALCKGPSLRVEIEGTTPFVVRPTAPRAVLDTGGAADVTFSGGYAVIRSLARLPQAKRLAKAMLLRQITLRGRPSDVRRVVAGRAGYLQAIRALLDA